MLQDPNSSWEQHLAAQHPPAQHLAEKVAGGELCVKEATNAMSGWMKLADSARGCALHYLQVRGLGRCPSSAGDGAGAYSG